MINLKTKKCNKCNKEKAIKEFPLYNSKRDKRKIRRNQCADCDRAKARKYWNEHPEQRIKNKLNFHYGISLEEYQGLLLKQNGVCSICGKPEIREVNGKVHMLCVDHDHTTNAIRGLLCSKCNTMLGMANDNPDVLNAASRYLLSWQK